jgi:endonuclease/exonuclease/phosphatase family metal-dependent hydrolase
VIPAGLTLRLATVNLQHGLTSDGAPATAERLAAAIAPLGADVVALQEVDHRQARSGRLDQTALLAEAAGLAWCRFAAALDGDVRAGKVRAASTDRTAPARAALPGYGVALLSRFPVLAWFAEPLPQARVWALRAADEPRVCLAGILRTPGGLLCVACTHLARPAPVASRQLRVVRGRLAGLARRAAGSGSGASRAGVRSGPRPAPAVLMGDLNRPPARAARCGMAALASSPTHPASRPVRQVDHILGSGGVCATDAGRALDLGVSDHLALVVDVRLPGTSPAPAARRPGSAVRA